MAIINNPLFGQTEVVSKYPTLQSPELKSMGQSVDGDITYDTWSWNPGPNQTIGPVVEATPAIGWNFAGFEVVKEKTLGDKTPWYINKGKKIGDKLVAFEKFDAAKTMDWDNEIIRYTALFNRNIYSIIVKPTFWKYDNQTKTTSLMTEIEDVEGVETKFTLNPLSGVEFFEIGSDAASVKKDASLDALLQRRKNAGNPIISNVDASEVIKNPGMIQNGLKPVDFQKLYKVESLVFGQGFTIETECKKTQNLGSLIANKYRFDGWYIQKGENPSLSADTPFSSTATTTKTINADFITNYALPKHENTELVIYAKYIIGEVNLQTGKKGEGDTTVSYPKDDGSGQDAGFGGGSYDPNDPLYGDKGTIGQTDTGLMNP